MRLRQTQDEALILSACRKMGRDSVRSRGRHILLNHREHRDHRGERGEESIGAKRYLYSFLPPRYSASTGKKRIKRGGRGVARRKEEQEILRLRRFPYFSSLKPSSVISVFSVVHLPFSLFFLLIGKLTGPRLPPFGRGGTCFVWPNLGESAMRQSSFKLSRRGLILSLSMGDKRSR